MATNIIYTTKLVGYEPIVWERQAMYLYASRLVHHLKQNLGEQEACLFAIPNISENDLKGFSSVVWTSEVLNTNAVPFTNISENQRLVIRKKYQTLLDSLQKYANSLIKSGEQGNIKWGEMIQNALIIPDESCILVDSDKIALVLWGFKYKDEVKKSYSLIYDFVDKQNENQTKNNEVVEFENVAPEKTPLMSDTPPKEPILKDYEKTIVEIPKLENKPVYNQHDQTLSPPNNKQNTGGNEPPMNNEPAKKKNWWKKNWWWLALILALLALLCYLFCKSNGENVLPDQPSKIAPIDSNKIVTAPDSIRKIVSDRFNVALKDTAATCESFAKRFKEVYPDEAYQIIYYEPKTKRLQISLPDNEREKVMKELSTKIPEFKILIYYEGIFKRNYVPTDPGFRTPDECWYQIKVKAIEAWDITKGNPNLVVAIIDDGFDLNHPELHGRVFMPWNVPDGSEQVNTGLDSHHGTHVAGIALASADNGKGVSGIAPNCRFMPIQVGDYNGQMSTTAVIDGVLYAIHNGANVVNMSLGMPAPAGIELMPPGAQQELINTLYKDEEAFWNEIFEMAYQRNIVFVLAGGNDNVMIGLDPMQRSKYTIKVSATDPRNAKANFSNYGRYSTISAPGVHIYSTFPNGRFEYLDGTSMASPVVAGGIALIKSANPSLSFDQIVDLIQSTGIPNIAGGKVGNLLQLDRAVGIANNNRQKMPIVGCPDVQRQIDSMLQLINKLREQCMDMDNADTMRIPPDANSFAFAEGKWKSTTYLYNFEDEKVTLFFDIKADGTGVLTLVEEDNTQCTAPLSLSLKPNELVMVQQKMAMCFATNEQYNPYHFVCKPNNDTGCADCMAQNKKKPEQNFTFQLIKTN